MRLVSFPFWGSFSVFEKSAGVGRKGRYQQHVCSAAAQSVGGSDARLQKQPFSIFPLLYRFARRMKTIPPAQRAAGSDASDEKPHVFAVSKKLDPSRPLHWRVPMALEARGSASGSFCVLESISSKFWKIKNM